MHWDWERDFSWHAFGTRRDSFNLTPAGINKFQAKHRHLSECVDVFDRDWAIGSEQIFIDCPQYQHLQEIRVFTEFLGANSCAGWHREEEPKELRLFDVCSEEMGFVSPDRFVDDFGHLPIARVVYRSKFTGQFSAFDRFYLQRRSRSRG